MRVAAEAGGVQGTKGDAGMDHPELQPANDDPVRVAPPELPAQDLQRYKQKIASSLQAGESVLTALRSAFMPAACSRHVSNQS